MTCALPVWPPTLRSLQDILERRIALENVSYYAAPGAELSEDDVREYCISHLARYKVPRYVQFVEELPVNAQGKIQKDVIRAGFDAN